MRPGQQNKRGRGRNNNNNNNNTSHNNRKGGNPLTRTYDSSGPDVKIRGTAQHIAEKSSALARDAQSAGDRVIAENHPQHAEHYNRIIAGNINQVLKVDSVVCDFNGYPYRAVTYATQKIIRQSNVTERSLVTTCRLLNASRSDDNPNGFTIEGFTIIENKDLQTIKR